MKKNWSLEVLLILLFSASIFGLALYLGGFEVRAGNWIYIHPRVLK